MCGISIYRHLFKLLNVHPPPTHISSSSCEKSIQGFPTTEASDNLIPGTYFSVTPVAWVVFLNLLRESETLFNSSVAIRRCSLITLCV